MADDRAALIFRIRTLQNEIDKLQYRQDVLLTEQQIWIKKLEAKKEQAKKEQAKKEQAKS